MSLVFQFENESLRGPRLNLVLKALKETLESLVTFSKIKF